MSHLLLAIDHGTTTTRAIVFDEYGRRLSTGQLAHAQSNPAPGWVEHDALEVWRNTCDAVGLALDRAGLRARDFAAVGIANQRETTVVWDRRDGRPIGPAIVWQDVRTAPLVESVRRRIGADELRRRTGLPLSTYFSSTKLLWMLDRIPGARRKAAAGHLLFGTMDTWLLWNLTGGPEGGIHATDPTNASRTALMDLRSRAWDVDLLDELSIPRSLMPEIRPSSGAFASAAGRSGLLGVPVTALIGDQQASLFAHGLTASGEAKCTYGTGGFVMCHTGAAPVVTSDALLPTLAYERAGEPPSYALEGSIAVAGSLLQWLRDGIGLIAEVSDSERVASAVEDSGGIAIVPAFSGLYAPHWRPDARGTIVGLTAHTERAHLVRAALEAIAHQVVDVVDAVERETGLRIRMLRADGAATANSLLMQLQSDLLGGDLERPRMVEMTALGAAMAAGIGAGMWRDRSEAPTVADSATWSPRHGAEWRREMRARWTRALDRSLGWAA